MKKNAIVIVLVLITIIYGIRSIRPNPSACFELSEYNLADSKFFGDTIISSNNGHLIFFDFKGNIIKEYEDVFVNWICSYPEEGLIIAGNSNKEIQKITIDNNYNIVSIDVIFTCENLMIDPTIIKTDSGKWILTYVEIEGNVNNADENEENGLYTVHSYSSDDLNDWKRLSDIVSEHNNIEDGDMIEYNNCLFYLYEKESFDKKQSEICIKYSEDRGETWSEEKIIIEGIADNEMAAVKIEDNCLILYYSSDVENVGERYNGAKVYKAQFDLELSNSEAFIPIDFEENEGVLLYDVYEKNTGNKYLYSRNYLTENTLILK